VLKSDDERGVTARLYFVAGATTALLVTHVLIPVIKNARRRRKVSGVETVIAFCGGEKR